VPLDLRGFFSILGGRLAVQEEFTLELHFAEALPSIAVPALAPRLFEHLLAYMRDVALASDPIRVQGSAEAGRVRLVLSAETQTDEPEVLRILDAPSPASGVQRFFQACGGSLESEVIDGVFTLAMVFPAVE
jgi:hypothetical protein